VGLRQVSVAQRLFQNAWGSAEQFLALLKIRGFWRIAALQSLARAPLLLRFAPCLTRRSQHVFNGLF